jgi:hypothetical protein
MSLKLKQSVSSKRNGREKRRGHKMKDSAIMLLKTNVEIMSALPSAIILMKISHLQLACHYVYENKGKTLGGQQG